VSEPLTWVAMTLCVTQSATLSGLNLAVFSVSRLRLETAAEAGDADARRVLALRRDANGTLATIRWGNVAVNVLLPCSRTPCWPGCRPSCSPRW
jgi:metal transporter CNNM